MQEADGEKGTVSVAAELCGVSYMILKYNQLTTNDFLALWNSVWSDPPSIQQIDLSLAHTLCAVSVYEGERVIGMARMIGDMGMCCYIKDVAVHPEFQHQGVGKMMLNALSAFIRDHGVPGTGVFAELAAEPKNVPFYEKSGFTYNEELRMMQMIQVPLPV